VHRRYCGTHQRHESRGACLEVGASGHRAAILRVLRAMTCWLVNVGGGWLHGVMANASTHSAAIAERPRERGKSKAPNFSYAGPMSVIPLELDASDEHVRQRLERQWVAMFRLRRALQRDAQDRCRAYWAAHHERARDPKALRERLGLTRIDMEASAKQHIEASGWMRGHLTKAIGMHVANEVWQSISRHLFPDRSGRRQGLPRIGSWWKFKRIPGRARSHTKDRPVWETWRLVGTLDGHLATYRHLELPNAVVTGQAAAAQPVGTSILAQPKPVLSVRTADNQVVVATHSRLPELRVARRPRHRFGSLGCLCRAWRS
jgi:hypothetical protein